MVKLTNVVNGAKLLYTLSDEVGVFATKKKPIVVAVDEYHLQMTEDHLKCEIDIQIL